MHLSDELNDLAGLAIPLNLLYDRFDPLPEVEKTVVDNRTAAQKESSQIFAF